MAVGIRDIVHCHVILQSKSHHACLQRFICHDNRTIQSRLWLLKTTQFNGIFVPALPLFAGWSEFPPGSILGTMIAASIIPVTALFLLPYRSLPPIVEVMADQVEHFSVQAIQVVSECYFVQSAQ